MGHFLGRKRSEKLISELENRFFRSLKKIFKNRDFSKKIRKMVKIGQKIVLAIFPGLFGGGLTRKNLEKNFRNIRKWIF